MKRHAYLIMAHNNFNTLSILLKLIDDARNDIYIHIDSHTPEDSYVKIREITAKSKVIFIKKRFHSEWGSPRIVYAEMALFEAARKHGNYHYYHLLSGSDLPLKNQNEIHTFFAQHQNSFIHLREEITIWDYQRLSLYHKVFDGTKKLGKRLNGYVDILQYKLKTDRIKKYGYEIKKGSEWCSLTEEAVDCLLKHKRQIFKMVRFTSCADEVYKQTILYNAGCPIYRNQDGKSDNMRLILWKSERDWHPKTFGILDYDMLINSNKLFARKFDETVDMDIILKIAETINPHDVETI